MFADMTQQKKKKSEKDSQRQPTPKTTLASPCFHIHRVIMTKQSKPPTSKMRRERVEGVGVHGSWSMKKLSPQAADNIEILAFL